MVALVTVSFTSNPSNGVSPMTVSFTDTTYLSGYTPTSWYWDFGDGQFSTLQNPTYTYSVAGSYTPQLTASGVDFTNVPSALGSIIVSTTDCLLSSVFNGQQFFDNTGKPLSGGKIGTYAAGSFTSQLTTYSDPAGLVPNSNPLVLDSSGRCLTEIWLSQNTAYQFVLFKADGETVLESLDNIRGPLVFAPVGTVPSPTGHDGQFLSSNGVSTIWVPAPSTAPKTYLFWLQSNLYMTFDGIPYNQWVELQKIPEAVDIATQDIYYDSYEQCFGTNNIGAYRFDITTTLTPWDGLAVLAWPTDDTVFGTRLISTSYDDFINESLHSRNATSSDASLPTSTRKVTWTDTFTVSFYENITLAYLYAYANSYSNSGMQGSINMSILVTRIGDAYNQFKPIMPS